MAGLIDLRELTPDEVSGRLSTFGATPEQIARTCRAVLRDGIDSIEAIPVARRLRERLADRFTLHRPFLRDRLVSSDGTEKFLLDLRDGNTVETVFIPEARRATLCLSTQVGCRSGCRFCLSGSAGLLRNLTNGEMLAQVLAVESVVGRRATNLVLMGCGEPLDNFECVDRFLSTALHRHGLGLSPRKITVSTSGVAPGILRMTAQWPVSLAVSLNAPDDELRSRLMPVNRRYPLRELMGALHRWTAVPGRRVFIEYILFADVNDSLGQARALCGLLHGLPCMINLIRFNPWPGAAFERPDEETVRRFQKVLLDAGFVSVVRDSRGSDIMAACGQLMTSTGPCAAQSGPSMETCGL